MWWSQRGIQSAGDASEISEAHEYRSSSRDVRWHAFGNVAGMICDSTRGDSQHEVAAERLANIKLALVSGIDEVNRNAAPVS